MPLHSLTSEEILSIEAKKKRDAHYHKCEAERIAKKEERIAMMENTDDDYFVPESNNEAYYLSNFA